MTGYSGCTTTRGLGARRTSPREILASPPGGRARRLTPWPAAPARSGGHKPQTRALSGRYRYGWKSLQNAWNNLLSWRAHERTLVRGQRRQRSHDRKVTREGARRRRAPASFGRADERGLRE